MIIFKFFKFINDRIIDDWTDIKFYKIIFCFFNYIIIIEFIVEHHTIGNIKNRKFKIRFIELFKYLLLEYANKG